MTTMNTANKLKYALAAVVLSLTAAVSAPALAANPPAAVSLGVVDVNKILQTSIAAKGIAAELDAKRKEFQGQIAKEEQDLRAAQQDIMKQKDKLSKEEFEAKSKAFEQKLAEGQKMVQEKRHKLDQAFNASMGDLRRKTAQVVAEVAKEKGFSAVFTLESMMLALPEMDITDEVITRLNAKVKKIPIDWSGANKAG